MKSLIKQRKKISFDCRVQIRRYELKKQKTEKSGERQTEKLREREREDKLSNKEEEKTE